MSLVEQFASERKARLTRMSPSPIPKPIPVLAKKAASSIDPAPFYSQMWFYDLICPRPTVKRHPTVLEIRDVVCEYFSVFPNEIESSRRQSALVYPRQIAFFLARHHTHYSYPQIARRFGDRDHTTIMHGCRRIESRMKDDWTVAYDIAHLEAML